MDARTRQATVAALDEPLPVEAGRMYRVSPEAYREMAARGLIAGRGSGRVVLADGLLTRESDGRLYRMPLDVYHRMASLGILAEHDPVVLLDGLLVHAMTRGASHVRVTIKVFRHLSALVPAGWQVRKEDPITLPGACPLGPSEPEPDVSVVRGDEDDYDDRHPGPGEVSLVVEVAESSLRQDRLGLARYARSGIPVAWLVNVPGRVVEVHSGPSGPEASPEAQAGYREVMAYGEPDAIPVAVDGQEVGRVAVRELFP